MTGQPNLLPWLEFDATAITASEVADPLAQVLIIDQDANAFDIYANFDGSGIETQRVSQIELWTSTNVGLGFTNWWRLTNTPVLTNGVLWWDDMNNTNSRTRFFNAVERP